MLVVYGMPGSPGASTTAIHVAAHWASSGREVLLIEADSAGGSMSRNMGIQFTPGAASFVASGSPVRKGDLIDHSQDVLFTNLHVMPCPSNPSSTREIIESFAERAEELRDVSENDMAVVIDAGRIQPGPFTELWTASAAGVAVVARGDSGSSMSSLEGVAGVLAAGSGNGSANRCVVTIGKPLWSPDDFPQKCGMGLCGTIEDSPETAVDMSVFLDKAKRKDKKWRSSLKTVAEQLLPLAAPEPSVRPRPNLAAVPAAPVLQAVPQTPAPQPEVPAYQTPPAPQPEVPTYQAPASPQPEVPAAYQSQVSQPGVLAYQTQPAPPAPQPEVPAAYQTAPAAQPEAPAYQSPSAPQPEVPAAYQTPQPQPEVPAAYQAPPAPQPQPEAAQPYQAPASPPPQPHQAPTPQPEAPVAYQHPVPPEAPTAYPTPPSAYPPAAPTPPYQAPAPQPGAPPYQTPAAPTGPGRPPSPTPSPPQAVAPPVQPLPIPAEPTPEPPDIPPSGSFRDLAARLHSPTASAKKAPSAGGISS